MGKHRKRESTPATTVDYGVAKRRPPSRRERIKRELSSLAKSMILTTYIMVGVGFVGVTFIKAGHYMPCLHVVQ